MSKLDSYDRAQAAKNLMLARMLAGYQSAKAASEALGIPQKTYYDHEQGSRGYRKRANVYAAKFGVTEHDLLHGQITPKKKQKQYAIPHLDFTTIGTKKLVKLLSEAEHSSLFDCGPKFFLTTNPDWAMAPLVMPGDVLAFCPDQLIKPGDLVLARITGMDEPIFRRFYPRLRDAAFYRAANPEIADIEAKPRHWANLARLQFIMRGSESIR